MLEFVVYFTSITGKKISKIFRNPKDVLNYISRYDVDKIHVSGEDFGDVYSIEEFEKEFENVTS